MRHIAFLALLFAFPLAVASGKPPPPADAETVVSTATASSGASSASVGDIDLNVNQNITVTPQAPDGPLVGPTTLTSGDTNVSVITENPDKLKIRNTASGRPPSVISVNPCRVPVSAGIGIPGFNGGAGTAVEDQECTLRQTAQLFAELGLPGMGLWMLCRSEAIARVQEVDELPRPEREAAADRAAEHCDAMVAQFQIEAALAAVPPADYATVAEESGVVAPERALQDELTKTLAEVRVEQKRLREASEGLKREYQEKIAVLQAQIQAPAPEIGSGGPAKPAAVVEVEEDPDARARYEKIRSRLLAAQESEDWKSLKAYADRYQQAAGNGG